MPQQTQQPYGYYTGAYSVDEDRAIYGLGSNRDMPSLCPNFEFNANSAAQLECWVFLVLVLAMDDGIKAKLLLGGLTRDVGTLGGIHPSSEVQGDE
ncbi:hypothetical protein F4781DRAFT_434412 [Annulohypoxylon bovei var. microspora]|nr:hypothetical protein F4781DRAFT_434412 [Annulohypoxylon bovei var. microspora]